ncbi:MAG: GatB/YqeY domain-containing protein [Pseudomonadota bacterium]
MSLRQTISDDMKSALRAREQERLSTLRMLLAAIKQREVDERRELPDPDVLAVVEKLIKQRRESVSQFEAGGRQDLAAKERAEIEVLSAYMPPALSDAEVDGLVAEAVAETRATGPKDMGKVMALLKPRLAGRADMSRVSGRVKSRLAGI